MQHFCFLYLSEEKLCSILVFGNVRFNIVIRINHGNVTSRGAVGRTHTFVRLQTRIRRKMERRISGVSYMCWMDFHDGILSCGVLCARLISFSCLLFLCVFSGYHAEGYHAPSIPHGLSRLYHHCTATTLVSFPAITP